ncbi:MAG: bi-domain-containing oxidoreductase [Anaerolineales bacterium]|nr:bi-domain-containing oxidoreductase [Anaerolineales bacterium]MDW8447648.1 bi-domain-containing oxidoreductase [Anaerolineales bacterium]
MKQVVHNLRSGRIELIEVPTPRLRAGFLLIKTRCSLVSAGTERMVIEFGEKSLVDKARSRPDLVRQALEKARQEGWLTTLEMALNRLDQPMPLGYSSAGEVVEVGEGVEDFQVGQRVACGGGGYAVHAEYALIPKNLVVRVPETVDDESAAFTTLGAIGMHAFRLTGAQVGSYVAVIGMGLVGFMAALVARAAGCEVAALELDCWRSGLAERMGFVAVHPDRALELTPSFTRGRGFDAVIIAADTPSSQPVELAAAIARSRATIVAAGAVGQTLPRKPYYEKELFFVNSRSYGPGRYDPAYEESGTDYPIDYVRWTEGRNLEAFIRLLEIGRIDVKPLITHRFPIEQAEKAYSLIANKQGEPFLGVLFTYAKDTAPCVSVQLPQLPAQSRAKRISSPVRLGVIGAGNFASLVLLPLLKRTRGAELRGLASAGGMKAQVLGRKYGFLYATSDFEEIMADGEIDAVFILTRHHLHAQQTIRALGAGKHVFCEKPLALNEDELALVRGALDSQGETESEVGQPQRPLLMVGFNRRFAPFVQELKTFLEPRHQPALISYRVNAGYLPRSHWVHDPQQGGGRLIGEVCHFLDTVVFLLGELPLTVEARALPDENWYREDNLLLRFGFPDGSIGVITYLANGDRAFPKERLELFCGGKVAVLEDFRRLELVCQGRRRVKWSWLRQDKGHVAEVRAFLRAISETGIPPVPYPHIFGVTRAILAARRALHSGKEEPIGYSDLG